MFESVPVVLWMLLPHDERALLAETFELPRTGASEIRDHEIITDGYSAADLSNISKERMIAFVGEPADSALTFSRLWELTVAKTRSIVNPPIAALTSEDGVMNIEKIVDVDASGVHTIQATISPNEPKNGKGKKATS